MLELEIRQGDIARVEADAIANAANDRLWMGAGVAGALKRAGGDEIEQEAMAIGGIPLGTAVATTAGRLHARWVIHGSVMGQDLRTDADLVRRTTRACLELAEELGARSIALPAFGTGVGGFSLDQCARVMIEAIRHDAHAAGSLRQVRLVLFGQAAYRTFAEVAGELLGPPLAGPVDCPLSS